MPDYSIRQALNTAASALGLGISAASSNTNKDAPTSVQQDRESAVSTSSPAALFATAPAALGSQRLSLDKDHCINQSASLPLVVREQSNTNLDITTSTQAIHPPHLRSSTQDSPVPAIAIAVIEEPLEKGITDVISGM